jgi:uncharacterized phage-associated protein
VDHRASRVEVEYTTADVVVYMIHRLGGEVATLKKLMKLIFLVQYDVSKLFSLHITKYLCGGRPLARAQFYLWTYGPVSDEVYDVLDRVEVRQDERGYLLAYRGTEPKLPQAVKARIDEVLKKYGGKKAWELEKIVKKRLGVDLPEKLGAYMGWMVEDYAKEEGIELKQREICG